MANKVKNKDAVITLKTIQFDGDDKVETELITSGIYKKSQDGYEISYEESEATGFVGSKTTLSTFGDAQVTMNRTGTATSNLVIEKQKKHHCHYGTPYGDFVVGVMTDSIENSLNEQGGDLYFKYVIDINSSYISDYEIYVNVKL